MQTITDDEFLDYERLKAQEKRAKVVKSVESTMFLEDDIDLPVRECVGMFALLGCNPKYSCCGFDYTGQPIHKTHQYGRPYFILESNPETLSVIYRISNKKSVWRATNNSRGWVNLEIFAEMNPHWRQHECIHFSEECISGITWLEMFLWGMKDSMCSEFVLFDTNEQARHVSRHWQYPPKEPWLIRKSDIISRIQRTA